MKLSKLIKIPKNEPLIVKNLTQMYKGEKIRKTRTNIVKYSLNVTIISIYKNWSIF